MDINCWNFYGTPEYDVFMRNRTEVKKKSYKNILELCPEDLIVFDRKVFLIEDVYAKYLEYDEEGSPTGEDFDGELVPIFDHEFSHMSDVFYIKYCPDGDGGFKYINRPFSKKDKLFYLGNLSNLTDLEFEDIALIGRSIDERLRRFIINRDKCTCKLCGKNLSNNYFFGDTSEIHIDHIIPVSKGGATKYTNLRVACKSCNLKKHGKLDKVNIEESLKSGIHEN